MVLVLITLSALPEKRKEVLQTLQSMIEPMRKEKGCLSYDVFCRIDVKAVFNLIEEWNTREDLDRHIRSERFTVLLGTKSLLVKSLEIEIHTVSHSEGAEVLHVLREKGES
ncbi:MAG: putative quinol monooxygenase [Deltaproteobacteria bacterium]|jgi:quinol monooxygenase YgiN